MGRGLRVDGEEGDSRRNETPLERLDRNLQELLSELRVVVTGVQVLFAFLLVVPFNVAPNAPIPLAAPVTTVGGGHAPVVNVASDPFVVPPVFVATARKWYSVLHPSPVIVPPPIATAALPDPSACAGVALP